MLMLATVVTGWVLRLRHNLFETGWFLRLCQWTAPLGFVAVVAGWTTTEVGRQPWTVFGLLRTANSVSPSLTGADVLGSLLLYMAVYLMMFPTGIAFMAGIVRHGVQGRGTAAGTDRRLPVPGAVQRAHSRSDDGVTAMANAAFDLVPIWTIILGAGVFFYVLLDGFDLGVGMLYGFAPEGLERTGDELDRADLGRQRDLADPRRRRVAGGVPAGLRDHHSRGVFPDPGDAAGAGVSRRGVRIPLQAAWRAPLLGRRVLRRLSGRGLLPGRRARRLDPGLQGGGPQLRRHFVRLADAILGVDRARADGRLQPARRGLADHEDRGRIAGLGAPDGPCVLHRRADGDRRRQHLDAVDGSGNRAALVRLAEHPAAVAGPADHAGDRGDGLAIAEPGQPCGTVRRRDGAVPDVLSRHRHQPVADARAAPLHVVGRGLRPEHAGIPAGRHAVPAAGDHHVLPAGRTGCFAARCAPISAITDHSHERSARWACMSTTSRR